MIFCQHSSVSPVAPGVPGSRRVDCGFGSRNEKAAGTPHRRDGPYVENRIFARLMWALLSGNGMPQDGRALRFAQWCCQGPLVPPVRSARQSDPDGRDIYEALDVLTGKAKILDTFSDWLTAASYRANCMERT